MKPFARINLSSALSSEALAKGEALAKVDALRRGILVSSLAREGRYLAAKNTKDTKKGIEQ